jgi:acyl carrier protein
LTPSTFDQIRAIASDLFGVPAASLASDSSPETIATWDSTQHLNLVLAIEDKFSFQLSPEEIEQMGSLGQIATLVEGKLQAMSS